MLHALRREPAPTLSPQHGDIRPESKRTPRLQNTQGHETTQAPLACQLPQEARRPPRTAMPVPMLHRAITACRHCSSRCARARQRQRPHAVSAHPSTPPSPPLPAAPPLHHAHAPDSSLHAGHVGHPAAAALHAGHAGILLLTPPLESAARTAAMPPSQPPSAGCCLLPLVAAGWLGGD